MRSISVTISASEYTNDPHRIHTHKTDYFCFSKVTYISLTTQFTIINVLLNTIKEIYPVSTNRNNIGAKNNV